MFWELLIAVSPIALFTGACGLFTVLPRIKQTAIIKYSMLTGGKQSVDYELMQMILLSLHQFPDDWKIEASGARFPKEGSYRIAIGYEETDLKGQMTVSIPSDSSGGRFTPVSIFFQHEISKILKATSTKQKYDIIQRTLFPDGAPLMITGGQS